MAAEAATARVATATEVVAARAQGSEVAPKVEGSQVVGMAWGWLVVVAVDEMAPETQGSAAMAGRPSEAMPPTAVISPPGND